MRNPTSTFKVRALLALIFFLLLSSATRIAPAAAQQQQQGYTPPSQQGNGRIDPLTGKDSSADGPDPFKDSRDAKLARALRDDRHKRLVNDTAKLVELSNELQTQVDKAGKDELSLDVIRKADEIEKLAHDVKERMKN